MNHLTFRWIPREAPLPATAVVTRDRASVSLVKKILLRPSSLSSGLKGCHFERYVIITGDEQHLPWVDGACYFGTDPDAPSLLLPTHSRPSIHPGLLEKAFSSHIKKGQSIIMPDDRIIFHVSKALPLDKEALGAWLEAYR